MRRISPLTLFCLVALAVPTLAGTIPLTAPLFAQSWRGTEGIEIRAHAKGRPVANAEIELRHLAFGTSGGPQDVATDSTGTAVLTGLVPGTWEIEISHPDYMSFAASVEIRAGKKPEVVSSYQLATGDSLVAMKVKFGRASGPPTAPALPDPPPPAAGGQEPLPQPTGAETTAPPAPPEADPVPAPEPAPAADASPPTGSPATTWEPESTPEPEPNRAPAQPPTPVPAPEPVPDPEAPRPAAPQPTEPQLTEPQLTEPEPTESQPTDLPAPTPPPAPMPEVPTPAPPSAVEPSPVEPAPVELELIEPEPVQPEPIQPEPIQPEPVQPEPVEPAPVAPTESLPAPDSAPQPASPPPAPEATPVPTPAAAPIPEAEPEPAPEPEPIEAPVLPPMGPAWRSFKDRTCFECQPGEWSVSAEAVVGPAPTGAAACPPGIGDALAALASGLGASATLADREYAGPATHALQLLPPDELGAVAPQMDTVAAPGSRCQGLAVVLPGGARYIGFRYEAADMGGTGDCLPKRECSIGQALWTDDPVIESGSASTVITAVFLNANHESWRRARLTVYFKPPSRRWSPPTAN